MFKIPQSLSFGLLLVLWWGANNIYAIDAELLFRRFPSPLLYIDLTFMQITLGLFLCSLYTHTRRSSKKIPDDAHPTTPTICATLTSSALFIGVLHFLGSLLTNVSYAKIGSTTTLMWKLTEPLSAVILKRLILSEPTSPISIFGVLTTLSGVLLFSKSSFTIPRFSPIILSNVLFPTRNVLIKLTQRDDGKPTDERFLAMLLAALPMAMLTLVAKLFFLGLRLPAVGYLLRNAMLFNAYQIASFLLLERLDTLTHSLLNTIKRFSGILLSMVVIRAPLAAHHLHGIGITIVGFCVYLAGGRYKHKVGRYGLAFGVVVGFVATGIIGDTVGDLLTLSNVRKVGIHINDIPDRAGTMTNMSKLALPRASSQGSKTEYVVYLLKDYHELRQNISFANFEEAHDYVGGNVGNLVWQYGAYVALPDFKGVSLCRGEIAACAAEAKKQAKRTVKYLPQANNLNPDAPNRYSDSIEDLQTVLDEIVIVGAGVQVEFRNNSSDPEFNSSAKISYSVKDYTIPEATKTFFRLMDERGGKMLLRGDFAHQVAKKAGFKGSYSVGCPSFWINEDVHLGRSLAKKYAAVASRADDRTLRVAINMKNFDGNRDQIAYLSDYYPNARFYAQGPGDMGILNRIGVPFERTRFFTNVEDWMADLRDMDVAYGVRIHGNMISLAAGLPVLVVASDWRVLELAQVMKLPHLTTYDAIFDSDIDIATMVKTATESFDGEAFDRNRCEIGKVYIDVLGRYGVGVREHVRQVAALC